MENEIKDNVYMDNVKELITSISEFIDSHEILKDKNFSVYYQHGRMGYMDLDQFAQTAKFKDVDGKERTIEEIKKELDKNKE